MSGPIVEVENLVKVFGGDVRALDDVSLAFEAGIIYGLLGPNGAGKTTLIRVLATLLPPDGGTARVAGLDVQRDARAVRERIGLAGQFAAVDEYLTGRENVEMVGRLYGLSRGDSRRRAEEILEGIQLADAAGRQVKTYSGGMRRRLDLAASLVGRPEVLFLDEPTTGIDPASRLDVWDLIHDLVDTGTTVLLTTQYLEEADQLADRIAVIDHGRLISEGTGDELKDRLGGSVLAVTVSDEDRDRTLEALRGVVPEEPVFDRDRGRITLPAAEGSSTLMAAVRRLDAAGIVPIDVGLQRPTLDDVFLTLTGHTAQGSDGDRSGPGGRAQARRRGRARTEA